MSRNSQLVTDLKIIGQIRSLLARRSARDAYQFSQHKMRADEERNAAALRLEAAAKAWQYAAEGDAIDSLAHGLWGQQVLDWSERLERANGQVQNDLKVMEEAQKQLAHDSARERAGLSQLKRARQRLQSEVDEDMQTTFEDQFLRASGCASIR
jgi:hypothetical protein